MAAVERMATEVAAAAAVDAGAETDLCGWVGVLRLHR